VKPQLCHLHCPPVHLYGFAGVDHCTAAQPAADYSAMGVACRVPEEQAIERVESTSGSEHSTAGEEGKKQHRRVQIRGIYIYTYT